MVPKKDRASGGAAIGVASIGVSGQAAFSGLLVVASILINWNYPLLLPFQIGSGATAHRCPLVLTDYGISTRHWGVQVGISIHHSQQFVDSVSG